MQILRHTTGLGAEVVDITITRGAERFCLLVLVVYVKTNRVTYFITL